MLPSALEILLKLSSTDTVCSIYALSTSMLYDRTTIVVITWSRSGMSERYRILV